MHRSPGGKKRDLGSFQIDSENGALMGFCDGTRKIFHYLHGERKPLKMCKSCWSKVNLWFKSLALAKACSTSYNFWLLFFTAFFSGILQQSLSKLLSLHPIPTEQKKKMQLTET